MSQTSHAGLIWHKALTCDGGACVQVAVSGDAVLIGDSKTPSGPALSYTRTEWEQFVAGIKNGDFDKLAR